MNNYIALGVSGIFAVLFLACGLPLFLKKIKPNYLFGYRISQYAMLDSDIWYAVNRLGGIHLLIIGAFLAINTGFAWLGLDKNSNQELVLFIDLAILIIGGVYSTLAGIAYNNKLAKAKGLVNGDINNLAVKARLNKKINF